MPPVLQASVDRLREVRYDLGLTYAAARLAVWFARVGRLDAATGARRLLQRPKQG